ncbi:MAG TPA: hypothetical protein VKE70_23425 [Candidatus Solibacter sp.]|nr:hypothetical protein [Candidatus Solibacter sp.]
MDFLSTAIDAVLRAYFAAFSVAPPVVGLTVLAVLAGIGMLWIASKTSNQASIKQVKRRVAASLLELRVFDDEPAVTGRALKSLIGANARYIGLALRPAVVMAIPMVLLLMHLESFYGFAPLKPDTETTLTVRMGPGWNIAGPAPTISAPPEVSVTSPAVRVTAAREITWRLKPTAPVSGNVSLMISGRSVDKQIEAGSGQRLVAPRRVSSELARLWTPGERKIAEADVEWMELVYPEASLPVLGFEVNWLVWFFAVSIVTALVFRKKLGVVI